MSDSVYSQGSEEGEIRPKQRSPTLWKPSKLATSPSDGMSSRPTARRGGLGFASVAGRGRMPPPPRSRQEERQSTLSEELRRQDERRGRPEVPAFPGFARASIERNADEDASHDAEERIVVQGPPPANMVTLSQEQRGISHHTTGFVRDSEMDTPASRTRKRKWQEDFARDPYQRSADNVAANQEAEDRDFTPPSQDTATTSWHAEIDPQEAMDLRNADRDLWDDDGADGPGEVANAAKLIQQNQQRGEKQRKKMVKEKYGVRHMPHDHLKPAAQQERKDLVRTIEANWPRRRFWPPHLAPKNSSGVVLDAKDVSTSLLTPVAELSELTRHDPDRAYTAMDDAVAQRMRERGGQEKLLPEDAKHAVLMCSLPFTQILSAEDRDTRRATRNDPVREVSQGARAVRGEQVTTPPGPRDTIDSSATFGRGRPSPLEKQEDDQIADDIEDDATESVDDRQRTATPLEDSLDDVIVQQSPAPRQVVPDIVAAAPDPVRRRTTATTSPETSADGDMYSQFRKLMKRLREDGSTSETIQVPVDSEWSAIEGRLKDAFYRMAMKADMMRKDVLSIEIKIA